MQDITLAEDALAANQHLPPKEIITSGVAIVIVTIPDVMPTQVNLVLKNLNT